MLRAALHEQLGAACACRQSVYIVVAGRAAPLGCMAARCARSHGGDGDVRLVPVPQEEDPETYQTHFASYIANDLDGDSLEDKYKEVHVRPLASCAGIITQL